MDNTTNSTERKKAKFLGVRQRSSGRWVAEIKVSSQKLRLWLGTYDRPEEAAKAYDFAARLLRGRNAKTNFPVMDDSSNIDFQLLLMKNIPRLHQLMQRDQEPSSCTVHDTVVCRREEFPGVSSAGGSRVYSSVVVVPSFAVEGEEKDCGHEPLMMG